MSDPTRPRLSALGNVVLTLAELGVALLVWFALAYDGNCYGFTDGVWPCAFDEYWRQNIGFLGFLVVVESPALFLCGVVLWLVNNWLYSLRVRLALRWSWSS